MTKEYLLVLFSTPLYVIVIGLEIILSSLQGRHFYTLRETLYRFIFYIPLALLGFHPLDIYFIHSLLQIYGILVHTQYVGKLGVLEYILVMPAHHKIHHASNVLYLDKNIGMTFTWGINYLALLQQKNQEKPFDMD